MCIYVMGNTAWINHMANAIVAVPLFADVDVEIYPHAQSRYHTQSEAKRNNVKLYT